MKLRLPGKYIWIVATAFILVFTLMVAGRNTVHTVKIKRQIRALARERERFREKIARDSALLERLRYDDYLEEYARERFRMHRRDEQIYILEE